LLIKGFSVSSFFYYAIENTTICAPEKNDVNMRLFFFIFTHTVYICIVYVCAGIESMMYN